MRNILIAAGAIVLLILLFFFWHFFLRQLFPFFGQNGKVTAGGNTFRVSVAKTQEQSEKGLSGKRSMGENEGMLFVFDTPGYYGFWMKEMKFPLDILFIHDNKIVTIYKNVPAPSTPDTKSLPVYKPMAPSDKVLEINAGQADKYSIKTGDTVEISL